MESYGVTGILKNFSCIVNDKKRKIKKIRFYNPLNFTNYKPFEYFKKYFKRLFNQISMLYVDFFRTGYVTKLYNIYDN